MTVYFSRCCDCNVRQVNGQCAYCTAMVAAATHAAVNYRLHIITKYETFSLVKCIRTYV